MRIAYILGIGVVAGAAAAVVGWQPTESSPPQAVAETASASLHQPAAPLAGSSSVAGVVLERIDVERYSYLKLEAGDSAHRWVAVPRSEVPVGTRVRVLDPVVMRAFTSKELGRTFDEIAFGILDGPSQDAPPAHGLATPHGPHGAASSTASPADPVEPVPRAEGPRGKTVAEVVAGARALDGQQVVVRAVVVKVVTQVLDRNWLHVRDGSQTVDGTQPELVVTTRAEVAKGQTVLVDGKVTADKDLGAGYHYDVLIEDAAVEVTP